MNNDSSHPHPQPQSASVSKTSKKPLVIAIVALVGLFVLAVGGVAVLFAVRPDPQVVAVTTFIEGVNDRDCDAVVSVTVGLKASDCDELLGTGTHWEFKDYSVTDVKDDGDTGSVTVKMTVVGDPDEPDNTDSQKTTVRFYLEKNDDEWKIVNLEQV